MARLPDLEALRRWRTAWASCASPTSSSTACRASCWCAGCRRPPCRPRGAGLTGEYQAYVYATDVEETQYLALVLGDVHDPDEPDAGAGADRQAWRRDVFGIPTAGPEGGPFPSTWLRMIEEEGRGVFLYVVPRDRLDLTAGLEGLLQPRADARPARRAAAGEPGTPLRDFGLGAQVLAHLGVRNVRLLTNKPRRIAGLEGYGIHVVECVPSRPPGVVVPSARRERLMPKIHEGGLRADGKRFAIIASRFNDFMVDKLTRGRPGRAPALGRRRRRRRDLPLPRRVRDPRPAAQGGRHRALPGRGLPGRGHPRGHAALRSGGGRGHQRHRPHRRRGQGGGRLRRAGLRDHRAGGRARRQQGAATAATTPRWWPSRWRTCYADAGSSEAVTDGQPATSGARGRPAGSVCGGRQPRPGRRARRWRCTSRTCWPGDEEDAELPARDAFDRAFADTLVEAATANRDEDRRDHHQRLPHLAPGPHGPGGPQHPAAGGRRDAVPARTSPGGSPSTRRSSWPSASAPPRARPSSTACWIPPSRARSEIRGK